MAPNDDSGQTRTSGPPRPPTHGAAATGADFPGVESLRRGDQLNGVYEIDALLARGGMGEVYKGHSIQTGDQVAIKVIRADLAGNEIAIALFRSEASKLHRLHHEAIIRYFVFSVDPQLNRTYLAMEFVEGESLCDILRRGPVPVEAVRRLAQRIALGLSAAHKRDIIHRDVSSDNIIIQNGDVDEAKIIDFGIARSTQIGTTFIDIGFAGKFNYVSPEQLGLYGGEVDARSDIYSLGLVLLEALRGEPADMGGSQVEVIEKRKSVPSLDRIDPQVRPIIEKMLQPDPARRQQSMQEVANDFAGLASDAAQPRPPGAGLPARPLMGGGAARSMARAPRQGGAGTGGAAARPWPLIAGIAAALALTGLGGGAYLWFAAPQKSAAPPDVVLEPAQDKPAAPSTPPPAAAPEPKLAPSATPDSAPTSAPAPPPASGQDRAAAFLAAYAGGPCFAIAAATTTEASAKIEALSASREAFDRLDAAFSAALGYEAAVQGVLVQSPQCAALDFFNSFSSDAGPAPDIVIDTPFVRSGAALTGSIAAAKDRSIEALLIGDDGLVQNVTSAVTSGRLGTFSIPAQRPKTAAQAQLVLFVSTARPLPALRLPKPAKAAQVFPAAMAEAKAAQDQPGVALRSFFVTE